LLTDHQAEIADSEGNTSKDEKIVKNKKGVTFSGEENNQIVDEKPNSAATTQRNFYMMNSTGSEERPNFLVGDEDAADSEEKDAFPSMANGTLTKQLSDAALMEKRRRLR